jgi:hypothetical protein
MPRKFLLATMVTSAISAIPATAQAQDGISCPQLIASTEAKRQIPRGLLMAIAVTESGVNGVPNPHAMNIAGKTYHARDLEDMAQVISNNWSKGVRSIDVGCMQINLKYHGQKFARLTDLLHSPTNVDYGASYLIKLAIDRGSWREGVMDYHNKLSASRRQWYGCKVWNNYLRINAATDGFINCGATPKGSSVASNATRKIDTQPISISGYNQGAAPQPRTQYASRHASAPSIGGVPIIGAGGTNSAGTASHAAPTHGSIPIGSPLDSNPSAQGGPIVAIEGPEPFDVPQPRQRVRGTIDLVAPGEVIGDITTSADPRASAFQSIRPQDWGNRIASDTDAQQAPTTTTNQGGFARVTQAGGS